MGHEVTITVQLDPKTYLETNSGGRWFNIPSIHPVTRIPMEQREAIAFATERGYLGLGFSNVKEATKAAGARSRRMDDLPPEPAIRGDSFIGVSAESISDLAGYDWPFNPGGRAPNGFMYPLHDVLLLTDAGVKVPRPTTARPRARPSANQTLIGGE